MKDYYNAEWNGAIEEAAKSCEDRAYTLRCANGESESWVWTAAKCMIEQAEIIRGLKR